MLFWVGAAVLAASPGARVELVFTGDVIPHDSVKRTAREHARTAPDGTSLNHDGWDHVFGPLAQVLRRADAAVVNLETPLTTAKRPHRGELVFSARPAMAQALAAVGVTLATFANNHALDQDSKGITETRRHLEAAGLLAAGAAETASQAFEPTCFEKNGLKVCVLAFTRFLNGLHNDEARWKPHVPIVDYALDRTTGGISERQLLEKVRELAAGCDALLVTPHWGEEYFDHPLAPDRLLAQALLEAGAVAVVGNHPHVLQKVETFSRPDGRTAVVAWSLGNLVSSQGSDDMDTRRDGLLLGLRLETTERGVTVGEVKGWPLWTDNRGKAGIQPVVADEEISAMEERLLTLADRADSLAEQKALSARLKKAQARRARILTMLPAPAPASDEAPAVTASAAAPRAARSAAPGR